MGVKGVIVKHVALYCRISEDPDKLGDSVEDQEVFGRAYAAEHFAGVPVEVFVDNDLSAAKSDIYRPGFERLREWIADGRVAHVWAKEQTRLARTNMRWFMLVEELEAAGISEVHTKERGARPLADLGTDVEAVVGVHEIRRLRERVNDKLDRLAVQGRPGGGVVFGYEHVVGGDKRKALRVVPEQAEVIRWAAEQILEGRAKTTVAKELAARGMSGARGGKIGPSTVESWLTSPTVAGFRVHRGELARDELGQVVRGNWEPILDEDTWEACRAKLAANARSGHRPTRRRYLLSGIVACECGTRMVGQWRQRRGRKAGPGYLCKNCGCGIDGQAVDDHVTGKLLDRLDVLADALSDHEADARRDEVLRELGTMKERRAMIGRLLAAGKMDEVGYTAARELLDEREATLTADLGDLPVAAPVVDAEVVRKAWTHNTVEERREIIAMFIERVVIDRSPPGAPRKVDLSRVRIEGPGWGE